MVSFWVSGVPVPKGSATGFYSEPMQRVVIIQDNKKRQKPWVKAIASEAKMHFQKPIVGAVMISIAFKMPRPKKHYRTVKKLPVLRDDAPTYHIITPDSDKLTRTVFDALTGIAWVDDQQVSVIAHVSKKYGDRPGCFIRVSAIKEAN